MSVLEESDDSDFGDIDFNIGDDLLKKAEEPDDFEDEEESEDISQEEYDDNYVKYDVKTSNLFVLHFISIFSPRVLVFLRSNNCQDISTSILNWTRSSR